MSIRHDDPRVQRTIDFFERLQAGDVQRLAELYVDDAFFKDPFNEVHTRAGIERIFGHMFTSLVEPRFVLHLSLIHI